jgi:hypothetical protein
MIAREEFPGGEIQSIMQYDITVLNEELRKLRDSGELADYSDDDLMTVCLVLIWIKPVAANQSDASEQPTAGNTHEPGRHLSTRDDRRESAGYAE